METKLQRITRESIELLTSEKTKAGCKKVWKEQLKQLKSYSATPSPFTIKKAVSDIRKGISERLDITKPSHKTRLKWLLHGQVTGIDGLRTVSIGIVSAGVDIAKAVNRKTDMSRKKGQSEKHRVTNISEMIEAAEIMLDSWDWRELAASICLLTGRRTVEVLKTGAFTSGSKNLVCFSGQAKTKTSKKYVIPTISGAVRVTKALKRLRSLKDFSRMDNRKINNIAHPSIERVCMKKLAMFTDKTKMYRAAKTVRGVEQPFREVPAIQAHDLRKIYTAYCVGNFMGNDRIRDIYGNVINSERLFVQAILGHEETKTGEHYENWEIIG